MNGRHKSFWEEYFWVAKTLPHTIMFMVGNGPIMWTLRATKMNAKLLEKDY
jgi:hypothetical protein